MISKRFDKLIEKSKIFILLIFIGIPIFYNSIFTNIEKSFYFLPLIIFYLIFSYKNIKYIPKELLLFFLIPLLSLIYAHDLYLSFEYFYYIFLYFSIFIIFYDYKYKKKLFDFILLLSFLIFLYVLVQKYYIYPYIKENKLVNSELQNILSQKRFMGTFSLPNIYAFFSLISSAISIYCFKKFKSKLYILIFLINVIGIYLSRTFIAFGLLIILIFLNLENKKQKIYFSIISIALITIFIYIRDISSLLTSLKLRYYNYKTAIKIYKNNPLVGVGFNNFDIFYSAYRIKDANIIHNAHSLIFQSLADFGMLGFFYLIFFIKALIKFKNKKIFIILLIASLYFFVDLLFYIPSVAVIYWIIYAMYSKKEKINNIKIKKYVSIILLALYFITTILYFKTPKYQIYEKTNKEFEMYKNNTDYYSSFIKLYKLNKFHNNKKMKGIYEKYKANFQKK